MVTYNQESDFKHGCRDKTGVLLVNLGSPGGVTVKEVRKYLAEFLWDPRVVERPRWLWWLILHGIILRVRPARSARAYRKIWTENGSPLTYHVRQQALMLQEKFPADRVRVEWAMRYGTPSIGSALESLRKQNVRRVLVFPLFPQYSAATTASVFDAVADELRTWRWLPEIRMIQHYHDHKDYVQTVARSIADTWQQRQKPDKLLFSFHGLPKQMRDRGDPYFCMCQKTARLIADTLALSADEWSIAFQSRMGVEEWLQPYTSEILQKWGADNMKSVHVVCPGFSADCLETLEEIAMQNKSLFTQAGGGDFYYIPGLNESESHIEVLASIARTHMADWLDPLTEKDDAELQRQYQKAIEMGAKR